MNEENQMPMPECDLMTDIVRRFRAMSKEEREARDLKIVKDALYHMYWCGNPQCEQTWQSLVEEAGHDPELTGIKDADIRKLILEIREKPMPGVLPRPATGIFEPDFEPNEDEMPPIL